MDNEAMSSGETRIEHVSDTALLVAAVRAMETERSDGVIRDPFAARLAGARGVALARALGGSSEWSAILGLRCRTVDQMLVQALSAHPIETVVLLGAGLDTRPWRLDLPSRLRWIDVDFPDILEYKAAILASEEPRCRVERIAADLTDAAARRGVLTAAGDASGLIVTEGLLLYLPAATTEALATEFPDASGIRYWLLDVASTTLIRNAHQGSSDQIEAVRAKDRVEGQQILDLVDRTGWRLTARHPYTREGFEIAAARGSTLTAQPSTDHASGVYLFSRF